MLKLIKKTPIASLLLFSALLALTAACVTVNVNFPEAAVQNATDDYVRDLYRAKEKGRTSPASDLTPSAKPAASKQPATSMVESLFISSAWAAGMDGTVTVNTAKANAIRDRLAARLDQVLAAKRAGNLGETNDGLLTLDHGSPVKPLLKKSLEPLVAAENQDRKELYQEVLVANSINKSRLVDIQKSFARSFQAESPSGTWVQSADGKWQQK